MAACLLSALAALAAVALPVVSGVRVGIFSDAGCTTLNPVTGSVYVWFANECSGYTGQPTGTRPPGGYGVVTALRSQALTACSPMSITETLEVHLRTSAPTP